MDFTYIKTQLLSIESIEERTEAINQIKKMLKEVSPFSAEPVECVQWVKTESPTRQIYTSKTKKTSRAGGAFARAF